MSETQNANPSGGARIGRILLVLLGSCLVGVLAGAVLHNLRRSREAESDLAKLRREVAAMKRKYEGPQRTGAPVDPAERLAGMRAGRSGNYRRDYQNIVAEARRITGAEGANWEKAKEILERHFEPMEKALDAFEKAPGWHPPDIQRVVASRLPATLEDLRLALGEDGWKKFDAWRKPGSGTADVWRRPRYAYFLLPDEYRAVTAAGTAALRWNLARNSILKLYAALELPRHRRDELEAVLRDHLNRYTAAIGSLGSGGARSADSEEKVAAAIRLTEEKLLKLLEKDKFALYVKWRDSLREPARGYFRPMKISAKGGESE